MIIISLKQLCVGVMKGELSIKMILSFSSSQHLNIDVITNAV